MSDPSDSRSGMSPSPSPHHAAHDWFVADDLPYLLIETLSLSERPYTDRVNVMPSPEQNEYFNRQSGKVNAGLDLGGSANLGSDNYRSLKGGDSISGDIFTLDIDSSQLSIPATTSSLVSVAPSTEQLVQTLLQPPVHAFPHGVLSIQWVLGCLGHRHFVFRQSDERHVLSPDSGVRIDGQRLGLPNVYLEWLCGDHEGSSPTEQAMMLTKEFFEAFCSRLDAGY